MAVKVGAEAEGTISGVDVWIGEAIVSAGRGVSVREGIMLSGRKIHLIWMRLPRLHQIEGSAEKAPPAHFHRSPR